MNIHRNILRNVENFLLEGWNISPQSVMSLRDMKCCGEKLRIACNRLLTHLP